MSKYDVQASIDAQAEYCEENKLPHFAPYDGQCWSCSKNIYTPVEQKRKLFWKPGQPEETYTTGIKTEEAATKLITGCPHCNRSYCD